jgi:DNA-binding response OmpR family regulator
MAHHVLIADDDRHFLSVLQRVLTQAGYTVSVANNGEDACAIGHQTPIDACVLDVALPLLSGPQVASKLGRPTLFVSGRDWDRLNPNDMLPTRCLRKPVDLNHVLEAVAELLGAPASPNRPKAD